MGSPVSVVVAEIVMQHIKKRALATYDQTLHFWFRYVDDTITILQTDDIDVFHGHLNRQNSDIQFTRELKDSGKIPFLDYLVSRDDTRLRTTVYRKPTHTDRLLDQPSYNPTSHRATTVRTLTRCAQIICHSSDSLRDENEHLRQIFHNDYSDEFIDTNKYKHDKQNDVCANTETKNELTTVSLPYIRGTSETIARINGYKLLGRVCFLACWSGICLGYISYIRQSQILVCLFWNFRIVSGYYHYYYYYYYYYY